MTDNSTGNKRIARNTAFLYIRLAIVLLITLYSSRVILNVLGVVDYGVYNVVAGFVSMFAFLNASFVATIQRFYNFELGKEGMVGVNNVYVTSLLIQGLLVILILILTETIGLWYLNNKLVIPEDRLGAARILFHCSVISMSFVVLQVPFSAVIMAFEKMDFYAIVGVIDVTLKLLAAIALKYILVDKLKMYAILLLGIAIIVFLMYYIYAKKNILKEKIHYNSINSMLFKSMMSFSAWSMFGAFAQVVRNQGLNIILNLFFGPVVNAARGISFQVKGALSGFIANISTSVRPQLVTSYATGNKERSFRLMFSISKICFLLLYLMALPICLEMDFVLHLWLGDVVPEYTIVFSRLILVIALVDVFNGPVSMIIYASGKIGFYNVVTSLLGLLILPLAFVILNAGYPPYYVYYMSLLVSILVQTASVIIMKKIVQVNIKNYLLDVIIPSLLVVLCSLPISIIPYFLMEKTITRVIVVIIISIVIVSLSGYWIGLNHNEKKLLFALVKKNKFFKR